VIADFDRQSIGDPRIAVVPNGVDTEAISYYDGPRDAESLIFTGNMGYQPNVDAVTWFAAECWPQLRRRLPHLRFSIVGARPAAAVAALTRIEGIEVVGPVSSMAPHLQRATVAVCPIRCGSGMQNKILEAMSAGVPVVTTAFANRSIRADVPGDIRVAVENDSAGFVKGVLDLLLNPEAARKQAANARRFVELHFSWAQRAARLGEVYSAAIAEQQGRPVLRNAV
jgi:glycosyltransferase involved in cell wall biosynthesis